MLYPTRILFLGMCLGILGVPARAQAVTAIVPDGRPHRFEAKGTSSGSTASRRC